MRSRNALPFGLLLAVAVVAGMCVRSLAGQKPTAAPTLADMERLYRGDKVTTLEGLAPYTGKDAYKMLVGPKRQEAYQLNYEQLGINYGEAVDFQTRREQVILCPQTAALLYTQFTPTKVRYEKGTRPKLEEVVAQATKDCKTDREKALALMRFCRDLYKKREGIPFSEYIYGGTEEQLIEKGEELCECLGRLMVALCEVAGMPGRVVMHDIGGHIVSEIHIEGRWAYIDPRTGIYFLKPDGSFASTWDIWRNPALLRQQSEEVKADVSPRWTWEERIWKCENRYCHPHEVTGFQNYSLSDAGKYGYSQKTFKQASDDGLFVVNKKYCRVINEVFGLTEDGFRHTWTRGRLTPTTLAYRHDGFSLFFHPKPPMTRNELLKDYVEPFRDSNTSILVWGLGPGSVFCFDTKVGQIFGQPLSEEQWKMMRLGDRRVYENVTGFIKRGDCPLRAAVERAHQVGLKVIARLEMNHEYGPPRMDNWDWVGFVGDFNKQHPEYRIPGHVLLDFKHKAVRDFKMAILREAAESGADGISMDFVVYPPHFAKPDKAIMTQFVRDIRAMLDEVGKRQNRQLELMVRVPSAGAVALGLDWKTWMREKLIDYIVPSQTNLFDIEIGEFVSMGHRTGSKVIPTIWQALGLVDTDPQPGDEQKQRKRYTKPKTKGMFFAQALLLQRAGADGLQFGFAADEWKTRPWLDDLSDPKKVEFADKHYMVNVKPHCPIVFPHPKESTSASVEKSVPLRLGDDIPKARAAGYDVEATLVLYATPLGEGEKLEVYINDKGPAVVTGSVVETKAAGDSTKPSIFDKEWWKRGQQHVPIQAQWLQIENNTIRLVHTGGPADRAKPFSIKWVDLLLDYRSPGAEPTLSAR